MINDLKLGFKLMKHGLQFKTSIVAAVLFLILGLSMELAEEVIAVVGSVYTMMGSVMIYQLVQSLTCAGLVQTSPQKKRLQTSVAAIYAFICTVILNTIVICVKLWMARYTHTPMTEVASDILINGILTVVVLLYMGTAMKAFWLATVVFITVCGIGGFGIGLGLGVGWFANLNISIGAAIVISYLAAAIGCFLMYLISLVFYKKDYSKTTFDSALKRVK